MSVSRSKSKPKARQARRDNRRVDHSALIEQVCYEENMRKAHAKHNRPNIQPLNDAQKLYDNSIFSNDITFGVGPAGTGKTWLAVMRAAEALANGEIKKIVLTRPAVEAGESLGFLPGELEEKYEPYVRPVRDALEEYFKPGHLEYLLKNGDIEARPLGLIRGSTIKDAILIADEMQNATVEQMKMLLTRIGQGARFIVNGDPRQCDLPKHVKSGLVDAVNRLEGVPGIKICQFTRDDIVRSGMAQKIVDAYES